MDNGNSYADAYAQYLGPYIGKPVRIAEIGILEGTGLAVWDSVFPHSELFGLDIDISNFEKNADRLRSLGAFEKLPTIYTFDQFVPAPHVLKEMGTLDVVMDDGCHMSGAIMATMNAFAEADALPSLYFVEDNKTVHADIRKRFPEATITRAGKGLLTIVQFPRSN